MRSQMYREQHKAIRLMVADLPKSAAALDADGSRAKLLKLGGALKAHLKLEDEQMYPAMMSNGSAEIQHKAKGFQEEMGGLAGAFDVFFSAWSRPGAIAADPAGFVSAWLPVKAALGERMDREDRDLYVMLDHLN